MGSIKNIFDVKRWRVLLEGENKKNPDDTIVELEIGNCCDYQLDEQLCIFMSKSVYEKCKSGDYFIEKKPYSDELIKIFDSEGNEIPPILSRKNEISK